MNPVRSIALPLLPAGSLPSPAVLDTVVDLLSLKHPDTAWRALGNEPLANREWRYTPFYQSLMLGPDEVKHLKKGANRMP